MDKRVDEFREFVELIARMKTPADYQGEEEPDVDDWITTMAELIVSARKLTGIEGPQPKDED